jgi:hypothetical protein
MGVFRGLLSLSYLISEEGGRGALEKDKKTGGVE